MLCELQAAGTVLKKIIVVRAFLIIILMYLAMKNRVKRPAAYSMLNPDTSTDSLPVRSNGARLVSAKVGVNHIIARGHKERNSPAYFVYFY